VTWKTNADSGGHADTYRWTKVDLTPATYKIDNEKIAVTAPDAFPLKDKQELIGVQRVLGTEKSATLTVRAEWDNLKADKEDRSATVPLEGECKKTPTDQPSTPPSTPPAVPSNLPGEPEPIFEADCDTMTIGLDNPVDGVKFTLKFKTSKGEERTLVIKPGEKKSETFSATTGFSIKLTFTATVEGKNFSETTTVEYEQPNDCDSSGGGGGLAKTGAAAGSIAGGAGALLAVGAGLFFMARRRKVKFTA
jgi:LPXTG-motif cell wall-anchored protein